MPTVKNSEKHDFVIEFPNHTEALLTKITLIKSGDLSKGKIFYVVPAKKHGIIDHMKSLTDQQCQDFMKTAVPLNSFEQDMFVKTLDLLYATKAWRSTDYHTSK